MIFSLRIGTKREIYDDHNRRTKENHENRIKEMLYSVIILWLLVKVKTGILRFIVVQRGLDLL